MDFRINKISKIIQKIFSIALASRREIISDAFNGEEHASYYHGAGRVNMNRINIYDKITNGNDRIDLSYQNDASLFVAR